MDKQDFFMEIAKTKHPSSATDREVEPESINQQYFPRGTMKEEDILPIGREWEAFDMQKERFHKELKELREQYQPFMRNFLPVNPVPVPKIELKTFQFRYVDREECFIHRWSVDKSWETVDIPDYRGPAGEKGKWSGYYACHFTLPREWEQENGGNRVILAFQCVDYIARIFVNGNFAGEHQGFFAPFSVDVTKYLEENNELVILCENDIPILGEGPYLDGDKIYAATGPGWNDPIQGWHHCPAGAGVFGHVTLELRPELYLEDVFVRTDIDKDMAEIRMGVVNYTDEVRMHSEISITLDPRNYQGEAIGSYEKEILCIGPGRNEFRYYVPVAGYRLWEPEHPWLYGITAQLSRQGRLLGSIQRNFGIRQFICDEESVPKGKFYLNHKPVVLRGANEMGHLQQCVMQGDWEQLIDDILIAKLCNLNYYRVTQRPVQEEIYDTFDMLGMMHQCDFPLFSYLRRPQFAEALRQVVEMEHLVRNHVSTVMVTFINEPVCIRMTENPEDKFSRRYEAKAHRHLLRDELEAFFAAARKAVYTENPDRVIKNVEGDYDGPTMEGMPDFHCYTMWYTNHGEPIGRLMRGYLPPVKEGWMIGCGEYGAEGLDHEKIMVSQYPADWLAPEENGDWYPDKIIRSQTYSIQGDWYPEQHTIKDWIRESQIHQAKATKLMTDAFRRRGDIISQTAIHLLIDAWPSGWMKALAGCDREPKPAYFAYQESLVPLKLNLYTPRSQVYEDETVLVECWVLNDTSLGREIRIKAAVWTTGEDFPPKDGVLIPEYRSDYFEKETQAEAAASQCAGRIPVQFKQEGKARQVAVTAVLQDKQGKLLHSETILFQVSSRRFWEKPVVCAGDEAEEVVCRLSGGKLPQRMGSQHSLTTIPLLVSSNQEKDLEAVYQHVHNGGTALLLLDQWKEGTVRYFSEYRIGVRGCGELFFADTCPKWKNMEFSMIYNGKKGYIDAAMDRTIDTDLPGEELIFTYAKQGFLGSHGPKAHLPVVLCAKVGTGKLYLSTLCLDGRIGFHTDLDQLLLNIMET